MTPSRPYLLRAINEWVVDNGMTPHLLVDAEHPDLDAPIEFAEEGRLVLNISASAVRGLDLGDHGVAFNARFAGQPRTVFVPMAAIMGIYARENGRGMLFTPEDGDGDPPPTGTDNTKPERPGLRVVK
ncbi:ClpXP protease specificity-enhancing factor [Spiribacter pallidus]|uniref:ClpXP protease specificity-enhancing factor n=1 Tax=Spiribacter pallidus TaxID=1987936 RepID=UPI0034A08729